MNGKKNILITGASGFIGQHLLEEIDTTIYNLFIISREPEKKLNTQTINCTVIKADLTNYDSLLVAFKNIDIIVNIAAEVRNDALLEKTNVLGTQNIVQAAVENKVQKIIHLSSVGMVGAQYNGIKTIVDEESICYPKNNYEKTKHKSEQLLLEACKAHKINLQVLRPTNVFGENHPLQAMKNVLNHINSNKLMIATKEACYNYVYVKDLTGIIVDLLSTTTESSTYNVGNSITIKDFTTFVQRELNKSGKFITVPKFIINLIRLFGISKFNPISNQVIYSDKKLRTIFEYRYGLEKGIKNTISYYKNLGVLK